MTDAKHQQAVSLLTNLERFVRLVVEREMYLQPDGHGSFSSPSPSPGPEKSPRLFGLPKPYSGLYTANSYMANRPNYRRSIGDTSPQLQGSRITTSTENLKNTLPANVAANGIANHAHKVESTITPTGPNVPKPAPRRISNPAATTEVPNKSPPLTDDDVQVLPKPITNEEFQAMIPAHFLNSSEHSTGTTTTTNGESGAATVTVTIKQPDQLSGIQFPPAPTNVGKVTETITKSTFTETVVTRVTDNQIALPLIIEVSSN